jgi:sodium/pantothenate symporter
MQETTLVTIITFVLYVAGTFVLAILSNKMMSKKNFMGDYFLGSRGMGGWALAFTFAATSASGGTFTGYPALIYSFGWVLALWIASYMVMPLTTMGIMGKRLNQVARKTGAITIPDIIRDRFESTGLGMFATCSIIFFVVANLVGQFKAGAIILETTFNLPAAFAPDGSTSLIFGVKDGYLLGLVLFAIVVIFYTAYGGFRAVVWTDVMQGIVMGLGVLLMIPLVLNLTGGLSNVNETLKDRAPFAVTSLKGGNNDLVFIRQKELPEGQPIPDGVRVKVPAQPQTAATVSLVKDDEKDRLWIEILVATKTVKGKEQVTTIADDIKNLFQSSEARAKFGLEEIKYAYDNNGKGNWEWTPDDERVKTYVFIHGHEFLFGPGRRPDGSPFHTLGMVISFFFMWAISGMGQPGTMVRLIAFKDSKTLKRAMITVTFYFALIYIPLVFIFIAARSTELAYIPQESADKAMSLVATRLIAANFWSSVLAAILVAAPFAAVMSTVDSFLLLVSSGFVRDIYQRTINPNISERAVKMGSYAATAIVGVLVAALAVRQIDFLQYIIVFTGSGLASVFLWPIFLGIYWKNMTRQGAWAAMLGGFLTHVGLYFPMLMGGTEIYLFGFYPVFWSILVPLFLGIVVSKLSGPAPEHLVDKYFKVAPEEPNPEPAG